jgi:penicillin-binding protein 1C
VKRSAGVLGLVCLVMLVVTHHYAELRAPAPTLILHDRTGTFLGEVGTAANEDGGYWPVTVVPEKVRAATLAAEDRRFYDHPGVDPRAVVRALRQNFGSGRRLSGASTLAMQVVRLQYPGARTYPRKIFEAVTALWLTFKYDREAILTHYLKIAPYGNRMRGISYAARRYLEKPAADLSWAEAAFLAALPQAPGRMNPFSGKGRSQAIERAKRILAYLEWSGALRPGEHQVATERLHALVMPQPRARAESAMHAVLRLEKTLPRDGAPMVETTLDLALQNHVQRKMRQRLAEWHAGGAGNVSVVVVDITSAEVLAWAGSARYGDASAAGSIDYADVPRSPGSALKPFFYALALERGEITPATVLSDIRRPDGLVRNADEAYLGPMLPRAALANSRNVPAVEVLERTGFGPLWDLFSTLRLHAPEDPTLQSYGSGLVLGNMPVTLAELTRAYLVLAGGGLQRDLVWSRSQQVAPPTRVFSENVTRQISLFLSDPDARLPTFPRFGPTEYAFPVAVKTGTSAGFHDAWAFAYSSRYLVGVWVGHPAHRPMRELSGVRSAAVLARDVMFMVPHADSHGLADLSFPPPRGSHAVRLCSLSGKRASDVCEHVVNEWFLPNTEPSESCDVHVRRVVDKTSVRTFVDLPARFGEWAASARVMASPDRAQEEDLLVQVQSPREGMRIMRDPEMPGDGSTLGLKAAVSSAHGEIVWYVDGKPFETVGFPFSARWPLKPGTHSFQARAAYRDARSQVVRVTVE